MRNAKLSAVLLLALSVGASAAVNETECLIMADVGRCRTAPTEALCDTELCTYAAGSCSMNTALSQKYSAIATDSSHAAKITAGNTACANAQESGECVVQKYGSEMNILNADSTYTKIVLNSCQYDGFGGGTCTYDFAPAFLDECISVGLLNSDLESGAISAAPTVAAIFFFASLLIFV